MTDGEAPVSAGSGAKAGIADALRGMLSFFTIIRLNVGEKELDAMDRDFWLAPVVGLLIGFAGFAVCIILDACDAGIAVEAAAAIATVYLFSKFLHFDGLADFGDGMAVSSGKREDHARALKDSLIGAGGLGLALVVVLLTFVCYVQVGTYCSSVALVVITLEALAKNAMVSAAAFGRPGDGMASRQVSCTNVASLAISTAITAAIVVAVGLLMKLFAEAAYDFPLDMEWWLIAVMMAVPTILSVASGWMMAKIANGTFGFVNGDVLGATNEISRAIILAASVVMLGLAL